MSLLMISLVFLLPSAAAFACGARTNRPALLYLLGLLLSSWLLTAYWAVDQLTGEGINSATIFHLHYGLGGAGFKDYGSIIWEGAAALTAAMLAVTALGWWRRNKTTHRAALPVATVFLLCSLALNPATRDIIRLATPPPPQAADFIQHYRNPALEAVADEHLNFIFIYAESFERTYFDESLFPGLIRDLRTLENEGTSFTKIRTVEGTGFTMGGIVASQCGIPLFAPSSANSMSGMDTFLPRAVGLSNLLHRQGYYLSFMGGAPLAFAGKGKFLASHQFDEMQGWETLQARLPDPAYRNAWGLYDDTLFDLAYEKVLKLSAQKEHFGLFLLTSDTHHPEGHRSKSVSDVSYGDGTNPMLNSVAASDRLIARFIRQVQASPAGPRTVIVLASDHIAMMNSAWTTLMRANRLNLFLVLDPRDRTPHRIDQLGSTLDTGTTLLGFLGYRGSIGLGRDLRDPGVSDAEISHIGDPITLLSWQGELEKFWRFPRFRKTLQFEEAQNKVCIDGRDFGAPLLIELRPDNRTNLHFEFDSDFDPRLPQRVEQLQRGTGYALLVRRQEALSVLPAGSDLVSPWVLVVGRAGQGKVAVPCTDGAAFTRQDIDRLLAGCR